MTLDEALKRLSDTPEGEDYEADDIALLIETADLASQALRTIASCVQDRGGAPWVPCGGNGDRKAGPGGRVVAALESVGL